MNLETILNFFDTDIDSQYKLGQVSDIVRNTSITSTSLSKAKLSIQNSKMSTPTISVDTPVDGIASDTTSAIATTSANLINPTSSDTLTITKTASCDNPTIMPGAVSTTQDVEMKGEGEDITSGHPASSLGKRTAGVRARENITSAVGIMDDDIYDLESSDDEKPLKKRTKSSKASETAPPPGKAQRRGEKGKYIGTHTRDPQGRLPVYAVYYPNGPLNCRVFYEDCSKEVQKEFKDFFHSKAQATMDVIKFDQDLFANVPNIQDLTTFEKKKCIRDYLATLGIYPPEKNRTDSTSEVKVKDSSTSKTTAPIGELSGLSKVAANTSPSSKIPMSKEAARTSNKIAATIQTSLKTIHPKKVASNSAFASGRPSSSIDKTPASLSNGASGLSSKGTSTAVSTPITDPAKQITANVDYSSDMHVGFWKFNDAVYVYAFLQNGLSQGKLGIGFRFHFAQIPEEILARPDYLLPSETLTYGDVDFEAEFNLESEEITTHFIKTRLQAKEAEKKQQFIDESDDGEDDEILAVAPVRDSKTSPMKSKPRLKSARVAGKKAARKLNQRGTLGQLSKSQEDVSEDDIEIEDAAAANDMTAAGSNAAGPSAKDKEKAQLQSFKGDTIRKLKDQVKDRDSTIAELKQTIRQMNEARAKAEASLPTTTSGKRIVGQRLYEILGSGPNAGKLLTPTWKKVFSNEKWFKEWTALSEIKLDMGQTGEMVEVQQLGEMTFWKVPNGTHEGILVQTVSDLSIFETADGKFIKWSLREELPKDAIVL